MYTWLKKNLKGDPIIWGVVIVLSLLSLMEVYSASGAIALRKMDGNTEFYLFKHGVLMVAGLTAMVGLHRFDYRYLRKLSLLALFVSVPLLLIALVSGKINGASRWTEIPLIGSSFQPSDIAKLALIAFVAGQLDKQQQRLDKWEALLPLFGAIGLVGLIIALTNVSTALLLILTCGLLMLIAGVSPRILGMLLVGAVLVGGIAIAVGQRGSTFISRVKTYVTSDSIPYQTEQSYIAIANGGILGQGPGNSYQKDFLPHPYNDFIYAIVVEEWGMVGGIVVMLAYLTLLYRGMMAVTRAPNAFGALLSAGLSFSLAIQAMLNMAVAVGLVPVTGQPLPMVSMGGSSLLSSGAMLGIILSVSRGDWSSSTQSGSPKRTASDKGNAYRRPEVART